MKVKICFGLDAVRNQGNSMTGYLNKSDVWGGQKAVTGKEVRRQLLI